MVSMIGYRIVLAAVLLVAGLAAFPAAASAAEKPARCAAAKAPGGDWRSFGHDYSNTRSQPREHSITPDKAALLTPAWTFSTGDAGGEGDITGTPTVGFGCVYVGTNGGWVFAINADTGERVWKRQLPQGGGVNSSILVTRDRVYAAVTRTSAAVRGCGGGDVCTGPYAVAFDRRTGRVEWATRALDRQPGADVYGSPVIFRGTMMLGISGGSAELGDEADRYAFQGSMMFLDADSGRVLRKTWTIHSPKHNDKDDFAGAGIWSTPAIDRHDRVAYVGTANPFRPQAEHKYANAVLRYDLGPRSRRFGRITGSYKGNIDEYVPAFSDLPCYDIPGNPAPYYPQGIGSCGDIDLDFGAAPNLFRGPDGRKLVGSGQKSGVYHVFDAKTMEPVWSQIVGPPTPVGGIVGSTAYDGEGIYGPVTVPGYLWSVAPAGGGLRWIGAIADGAHWGEPVAVANGVVYTVDLTGFLDAFDATTGAPLLKRPLFLGGSGAASLSWAGVSVARNTVYAGVGMTGLPDGFVVAYRPGGPEDLVSDLGESVTGLLGGGGGDGGGEGGSGAAIVAAPGSAQTTYATPVMLTQVGGPLSFVNLDAVQHDVVAEETLPNGRPLFSTPLISLGESAPVDGLENVKAGTTYGFYCSIHRGMRGSLVVQ